MARAEPQITTQAKSGAKPTTRTTPRLRQIDNNVWFFVPGPISDLLSSAMCLDLYFHAHWQETWKPGSLEAWKLGSLERGSLEAWKP